MWNLAMWMAELGTVGRVERSALWNQPLCGTMIPGNNNNNNNNNDNISPAGSYSTDPGMCGDRK